MGSLKRSALKIEFGGGETPKKPDFLQCDVRQCTTTTYVCNAWEIVNHVEPKTVNEIYSRHFLEHLTYYDAENTLMAWYIILKPGGFVTTIVPDIEFHIKQWEAGDFTSASVGFWGKQRETEKSEIWDIHKSGYNYYILEKMLKNSGFRAITRQKDLPKNLTIKAVKM